MSACTFADALSRQARTWWRRLALFLLTALFLTTGWADTHHPSTSLQPCAAAPNGSAKVDDLAKRSVPDLIRLLQIGTATQKGQAAHALGRKAYNGDAASHDAVPALLVVMRALSGGRAAEDAAEALAQIGPPALDLLKAEASGATRQTTQSGRVFAARALGLMGASAKESAAPVLTAILENPRRSAVAKDPLVAEAALALASMGGPYKPSLFPDIIGAMNTCASPERQLAIAVQIAATCTDTSRCSDDLARILGKAAATPGIPLAQRQEVLDALVKMNTPSSIQSVLFALAPPQKNLSYSERATAAAALAKLSQPSQQVLASLIKALQAERSGGVISPICRALATYGAHAQPALPALETYLKELPQRKGLDGGENEKPSLVRALKTAIGRIAGPSSALALQAAPALAGSQVAAPDAFRRLDLSGQVGYVMQALTNAGAARLSAAEYEAALVNAFADPHYAAHRKGDLLSALARLNTPSSVRHVCDVLVSPNTYRDPKMRESAALALASCRPPPPEAVDALHEAVKTETSAGVVMLALRTLKSYGAAAAPTLPTLERYLQDLPANARLDSGDKEKPWLESILVETVTSLRACVASSRR
jgi:hypothetical protein